MECVWCDMCVWSGVMCSVWCGVVCVVWCVVCGMVYMLYMYVSVN